MTPRELEILHTVYQLGGQSSLRAISKKTGLSLDYNRGLAKVLLRQHLLEQTASRLLALTVQGRSFVVERCGIAGETAGLGLSEVARLVSRQTGMAPVLPPEPSFFSPGFIEEPVSFVKHDFNKNQTVELIDAQSIQAGINGLISINSLPSGDSVIASRDIAKLRRRGTKGRSIKIK